MLRMVPSPAPRGGSIPSWRRRSNPRPVISIVIAGEARNLDQRNLLRGEEAMGPLEGIRIVELAGIGPGPFCAMLLSDMGAEVIRVDRAANRRPRHRPRRQRRALSTCCQRGRRNIAIDLKNAAGVDATLRLIDQADALIEGFRPGVMERLGLGARSLPRAQPEAGLWPDDRLGPGRADCAYRRARHQLHRAVGCAATRSARRAGRRCRP